MDEIGAAYVVGHSSSTDGTFPTVVGPSLSGGGGFDAFAAKQKPARSRKTLTVLVIVMVLMVPVGGGVLWYLQSASMPSIVVLLFW